MVRRRARLVWTGAGSVGVIRSAPVLSDCCVEVEKEKQRTELMKTKGANEAVWLERRGSERVLCAYTSVRSQVEPG